MYGLLISTGILIASLLAERQAKLKHMNTDIMWEGLMVATIFGILGARLYHVLDFWELYKLNPIQIIQIYKGGLGIYGALIFGFLSTYVYLKLKKQNIWSWLDLGTHVLPLGQAIGRIGNFFNGELLPFAIYESILDFILFLVLYKIYPKIAINQGQTTKLYLLGYACIRLALEGARNDGWVVGDIHIANLVSLVIIIVISLDYVIHSIRPWGLQNKTKDN